ncbi:hypothetical protein Hanom_Chr14g01263001 [Helianthus anomalus]
MRGEREGWGEMCGCRFTGTGRRFHRRGKAGGCLVWVSFTRREGMKAAVV